MMLTGGSPKFYLSISTVLDEIWWNDKEDTFAFAPPPDYFYPGWMFIPGRWEPWNGEDGRWDGVLAAVEINYDFMEVVCRILEKNP